MTAIAELRKKALEQFPGYPIEFDDGTSIRLRSNVELPDETLIEFRNRANAILESGSDEDTEVSEFRKELVETLALVADKSDVAKDKLSEESLAILLIVLQEYLKALQDAAKDEDAPKSEDTPKARRNSRTRANS